MGMRRVCASEGLDLGGSRRSPPTPRHPSENNSFTYAHPSRRIPPDRRLRLQQMFKNFDVWVCDAPYAPYIYIYMSHTSRRIPQISVCNFNKYSKLRRLGMRRALCAIYIYMSHTPRRIPQNRRLQLQHISDSLIWVCDAPYAPYIYIYVARPTSHTLFLIIGVGMRRVCAGYFLGMRRGYAPREVSIETEENICI